MPPPDNRYVTVSGAVRMKYHGTMITSALVKACVRAASLLSIRGLFDCDR